MQQTTKKKSKRKKNEKRIIKLKKEKRTMAGLSSTQTPTFAICALMPLACNDLTALSAYAGDSKSTKP